MKTIRVRNLRSLKDTGDIELKPITLLVGANSSGKSTFLRTFPLFKQSVNTKKTGPLLWYGTEVDFGSYSTALRKDADAMMFSFYWSDIVTESYLRTHVLTSELRNVSLNVTLEKANDDALINQFEISIGDNVIKAVRQKLQAEFDVFINGHSSKELGLPVIREFVYERGILPVVLVRAEGWGFFSEVTNTVLDCLQNCLRETSLAPYSERFNADVYAEMIISTRIEMAQRLVDLLEAPIDSAELSREKGFEKFVVGYLLANLRAMCSILNEQLDDDFNASYYIKPFRASAERYYRKQNLAVDALDSDGHNMAMFVSNMYKNRKIKPLFTEWTKRLFKFELNVKESEGHVSLAIKEADGEEYNLMDKGYGYSQILPIILTLWQIYYKYAYASSRSQQPIVITIEQPELHLHPKLQAKLMDCFALIAREGKAQGLDVKFIIETHSQTMVNRLGTLIARSQYTANDAIVLIFHEQSCNEESPQVAGFSNEGYLTNWPIGFFEAE